MSKSSEIKIRLVLEEVTEDPEAKNPREMKGIDLLVNR